MLLTYENKKSESAILGNDEKTLLESVCGKGSTNKLIQGDNLPVLRTLLDAYRGKVDLIYIDPPFATNGQFRIGADRAKHNKQQQQRRFSLQRHTGRRRVPGVHAGAANSAAGSCCLNKAASIFTSITKSDTI